jgi:uncharacterized protein (TIGR03067 family)
MRTALLTTATLGLALLVTSPARADDKPTGDLAKLQGKWTTKYGPDKNIDVVLVFEGKSVTATFSNPDGGKAEFKGQVAVNEAAKPNKTIDFTGLKRDNGEEVEPGLGIYVIEDDNTIKVCNSSPGKERPTEFKGEPGGPELFVLKREGAAKAAPKGDLAKLQGKWSAKLGPEKNIDIVIVIDGKTCNAKATLPDRGEFEVKGEIALNETAKPNKTIDWKNFKGPDGNDIANNPGIYVIEDDNTVKVCNGGPGKERPTEFKGADEGEPTLFTLKREAAKPADKPAEIKGDLAKFQGDWTGRGGREGNTEITVAFKGDKVTVAFKTPEGEERTMKGDVVLDDSAKPHKAITFKNFTGPDGNETPEVLGIYALDGDDALKICHGGPGDARPTEIKAGEGGPPRLVELKRKK